MHKSTLIASGIVIEGTRALVVRREGAVEHAGAWDFPGTVLENGEDPRAAVARAFKTAGVPAAVGDIVEVTFQRRGATRSVLLLFYEAMRLAAGAPLPASGPVALRWAEAEEMEPDDFPPDQAQIVKKVQARLLSATWSS